MLELMQAFIAIVPSLGPSSQSNSATLNLVFMLLFLLPLHFLVVSILKLNSPDNHMSWLTKFFVRFSIPISILCVAIVTELGSDQAGIKNSTGNAINTLAGIMFFVGVVAYVYALSKR